MSWHVEETDHRIIIYLDAGPASIPMEAVCERAKSSGKRLVLDFAGVAFMSSEFIGQFILLHKQATTVGVQARITNVRESVMEVFRITKVHKVFEFEDGNE